MALQRRKLLAQALNLGYGTDTVPADSGGLLTGDLVGIHTLLGTGYLSAADFIGSDAGAKIAAAIAALPSTGGVVDARSLIGNQTIATAVVIPASVTVLLGANLYTCTSATAGFQVTGAAITTQHGGIVQDAGGILKYTGAGAAILLAPGGEDLFISGFVIDIDTIDCNGTGAYGIQFGGAGWIQRTSISFKLIWHFTASGIDFQLGRKNGTRIYGVDIDGSNVAGTAALGTYGINFEDPSAQTGYNLYEANYIEICAVRNTTSYALRTDFYCGHNYFVVDGGNDYGTTTIPIYLSGNSNTLIIKGTNPWTDVAAVASVGGAQARYPSLYMQSSTLAGTNIVMMPSKFLGGIIDENLGGAGANILTPAAAENFLLNGSFENVDGTYPIGWTASAITPAAITNQAKHGRLCLETAVAATTVGYLYQALPSWVAGQTITVCGWVKNGTTGANSGVQAIAIYDDVGIGGLTENYTVKPNTNGQWNYICVTKTIPGGATTIQVRLYADRAGTNVGGQSVLWDGLGAYFGIQPSMPSTSQSGAIGVTLLPKKVGIGTITPNGDLDIGGGVWWSGVTQTFNGNAAIVTNAAGNSLNISSGTSSTLYLEANGGTLRIGENTAVPFYLNAAIAPRVNSVTLANGANNNIAAVSKSSIRIGGPTGAFNVTGFTGGVDGQLLYVFNASGQAMTLTNNSGASTQKILTLTGADIVLRAGSSYATLQFDNASTAWIVVATN